MKTRNSLLAVALATALAWCGLPLRAGALLPVPDAEAQRKAEVAVRQIYKDEFAQRSPEERRALAEKLLAAGDGTADDAAAKYVLLRQAAEVAAGAGDFTTVAKAAEQVSAAFAVDAATVEAEALLKSAGSPATAEAGRALADRYVSVLERLIARREHAVAARVAPAALAAARKGRDPDLTARLKSLDRDVKDLAAEAARVKGANAALASNPDDPNANLVVGRALCFTSGDWDRGLPYLAKASDAAIRALARRDLASPARPKEQAAVADGWYELASKERAPAAQANLRRRAAKYYGDALAGLTGLDKVRVEKRVAELKVAAAGASGGTALPAPKLGKSERQSLTRQKDLLLKDAEGQRDPKKRLALLTDAAKLTLRLDPSAGLAELEDIAAQAAAANDADAAGQALITQGEYLASLGRWKDAEAALARVWTDHRGSYGDKGCAAATVLVKHHLASRRPEAAIPYLEIVMDCGGSYGGPAGDAGLMLADYHLGKGERDKAITYLKRVVEHFPGPYGTCKEKAEKKLKELDAS
jgi:hypothetical protein